MVEPVGFSMYNTVSSANNDSVTSSFPISMPFISSGLIAVSRTSNTMSNKKGESRHAYLVPDLKGNPFSFYPLSTMLAGGFPYMAFIMLSYVPSIPTLPSVFIINGCGIFIKCFFCIYRYDHVIFVFHFAYVVYHIYCFANIVPSFHLLDKSHLIMVCMIFLM